ncbi:MAG: zinc ribbon domain-containing protein [Candidatus Thorarchaeota archaeon]|nr:zinc ribbon domain-containing protein [Candidatus Thorarchaeota archaeon]
MSVQTAKSTRAAKLFVAAAVMMFVQAGVIVVAQQIIPPSFEWVIEGLSGLLWIVLVFGLVFLGGAFFARTGLGVTATTDRYIGGGYYQRGVETANGITCGFMVGLGAILIVVINGFIYMESSGGLVFAGLIPAALAGVFSIIAGLDVLKRTYSTRTAEPQLEPRTVPSDSVDCPYCGKSGISPHAKSCPSCGQPLQ